MAITNGDFETGDLTGWTTSGTVSVTSWRKHTGIYSCHIESENSYIEQDIVPVAVDVLESFALWYNLGWSFSPPVGVEITVKITYTDDTYTEIVYEVIEEESDTWTRLDILSSLTSGKLIKKIRITRSNYMGGACYIDDVQYSTGYGNVDIENGGGKLSCYIMDIREIQACKVAVRDVPLRTTGSFVDTGTWILKNRRLYMTMRLADAYRATLQAIFNYSNVVTVTAVDEDAGTWIYTGWLVKKPLVYEYSKYDDGNVMEWVVEMAFVLSSFSYA